MKLLWRTFGHYNIVATILCDKGDVGTCIYNLRKALEDLNISVNNFETSISITWEKGFSAIIKITLLFRMTLL
ncbi:MAG: hypothetical protein QXH24_01825 [Candidatus Bathyarchaeia archaeon]